MNTEKRSTTRDAPMVKFIFIKVDCISRTFKEGIPYHEDLNHKKNMKKYATGKNRMTKIKAAVIF